MKEIIRNGLKFPLENGDHEIPAELGEELIRGCARRRFRPCTGHDEHSCAFDTGVGESPRRTQSRGRTAPVKPR